MREKTKHKKWKGHSKSYRVTQSQLIDLIDPLNLFILALAFVATWLILGFIDRNSQTSFNISKKTKLSQASDVPSNSTSLSSIQDPDLIAINLHNKTALVQSHFKKAMIEKNNQIEREDRQHSFEPPSYIENYNADYLPSTPENPIKEFLTRNQEILSAPIDSQLTPEDKVNQKIASEVWAEHYNEAYEKAYVDSFIQNAKRDGLEIVLDTQYNIVKIRALTENERTKTYTPSK